MDIEAGQPVTLRQIARAAGVSIATVSRALRRPDAVSAETRARILALVARHRYVPDAMAASFASRRTGLVGLIVPTISNSIYAAFTEAVQNRLQAAGRKLLIANANYSATLEPRSCTSWWRAASKASSSPVSGAIRRCMSCCGTIAFRSS